MADDDYSKPAKGETAAQAADRRAKFYSKQRQDAEDAADSKGDEKTKRGGAATAAKVYGKLAEGQRKKLGYGILNPFSEKSAEARGTEAKGQEYDAQAKFGDWGRNVQSAADGAVEVATNIAPYIAGAKVAGGIGKGVAEKVGASKLGKAVSGSKAGQAVGKAMGKVKSAKDAVTSAPGRAAKAVGNKVKDAVGKVTKRGGKAAEKSDAPERKSFVSTKKTKSSDFTRPRLDKPGGESQERRAVRMQDGRPTVKNKYQKSSNKVTNTSKAKPAEAPAAKPAAAPSGSGRRVTGASDSGTKMASGVRKTGVKYDAENASYRNNTRASATTADARAELSGKKPQGSGAVARAEKSEAKSAPAEAAKPATSSERTPEQKAAYEKYKSLGRTKKGTPENEERKAAWRAMHKDDQRDYTASKPPRAAAGDTTATKPKGEEAPKKGRPRGRKTGVPTGGAEAAEKASATPRVPKRKGIALTTRTDSAEEARKTRNAIRPDSRMGKKVTAHAAEMEKKNGVPPWRLGIATTKAASKSAAEKGVKNKALKELHKRKVIKHVKVKKSDA